MKKSFKWLLCAVLAVSMFMTGCEYLDLGQSQVPHEHTYATTYTSDKNGHWIETTCTDHAVEKLNLALHTDANNDGVCETCKYDEHNGAGHTFAEVLSKDETNHWYAATCGHDVAGKDVAAHVDANNDKLCDVEGCGYDYNHKHAYATTWSTDETYHWHAASCGCTIEGEDKAEHVDADKNGVCEICEEATYAADHTHTFASGNEWSNDEKNHWYAATCAHTGLKQSVTAHVDQNKDGECDVCKWFDAAHTHTYSNEWSKNETEHWQAANCGHTGLVDAKAAHEDKNNDGECDTCGYDGNHEHTYGDEWVTDETNHWLAATCGCSLTVATTAHDGMEDGECDTCGYEAVCDHTPAEEWVTDESSHWQACADHPAVTFNAGDHEGMGDGVCDICEYADYENGHVHTYDAEGEWTSDFENHWIAGSCHTELVKEGTLAAHADEDEDGACDVCLQELFETVIAYATSEEVKALAKSGHVYEVDADYGNNEYYYEYGTNYLHVLNFNDGYKYWYHNYNDSVFAMSEKGTGIQKEYVDSEAGLNIVNGLNFDLGYYVTGDYGVENTIATVYEQAVAGYYTTFEKYGEDGVYGFTFNYLQEGYYTYVVEVSVDFEISEAEVYSYEIWDYVYYDYISSFEISVDTYEVETMTDGYYVVEENAVPYLSKSYVVTQLGGEQTAESPFDPAEYFVASYDLTYNDEVVTENTTIQIEKGSSVNLYYTDVESKTGDFSFETMMISVIDAEGNVYENLGASDYGDNLYIDTDSADVGTYTVTVTTANTEKTFTVVVKEPAVSSFDAWVYDDAKTVTETWNVYVGGTIEFGAKTNNYVNNGYLVVASGEEGDVTLSVPTETNNTSEYAYGYSFASTATFNKVGTYMLTLTSLGDSSYTAIITVTVSEPPKVEDVLNGSYSYTDYYGSSKTVYVTFTPATEGALNGAAAVTLVDRDKNAISYNVNYAYDTTNGLVIKNADGSDFIDVMIVYANYELTASWMYEGWWGPEPTEPGVLTVSEPYAPPKTEDMVAGQYRLEVIGENGWSLESATDIVLNADGTGTYTRWHFDDNYDRVNDATATFKWTVVANEDGTYTVTVTDLVGATEVVAGTWTVKTISGVDDWGFPTTYTAITGVMVNNVATEFPIYE